MSFRVIGKHGAGGAVEALNELVEDRAQMALLVSAKLHEYWSQEASFREDEAALTVAEVSAIASESEGKWRNTRATNRIVRVLRSTETVQEKYLRSLHETMRSKNATRIIVITTGEFAQSAVDFANTRPIELYGKNELINMLRKF